ncbi:hypothetical protein PQX77_014538 [Marasmius sp. AFHP31]|nr:hypothetical protein PQX77_014538 [Marasmius sp. AFHP31]
MPEVTEWFDLVDGLAAPGSQVRDLSPSRIAFDKSPRASDQEAEGARRSDYLDRLLVGCKQDLEGIVVATDASVPPSSQHQSVAGFEAYVGGERVFGSGFASGHVLAPCAELVAIRFAVTQITSGAEPYKHITIFTDSIASAERAVDPSLHLGQAHSLAMCKALNEWFLGYDDQEIVESRLPDTSEYGLCPQQRLMAVAFDRAVIFIIIAYDYKPMLIVVSLLQIAMSSVMSTLIPTVEVFDGVRPPYCKWSKGLSTFAMINKFYDHYVGGAPEPEKPEKPVKPE